MRELSVVGLGLTRTQMADKLTLVHSTRSDVVRS